MSYSQQELEALLQNDEFVRWVLQPDAEGHAYWESWMNEHPDRRALVMRSRDMIRLIHESERETFSSQELAGQIWEDMQDELHPRARWYRRYAAAAAVLVLLGLAGGGWYLLARAKTSTIVNENGILMARTGHAEISVQNTGDALRTVYLVDGSRITLSPGAKLKYHSLLGKRRRDVTLEGEAFFEIAPDAAKPFSVRSRGIVTRVLGTSFRIAAQQDVVVSVRSGKVAVMRQEEENTKNKSCILVMNEQAVYNASRNKLEKTAAPPALLANPAPAWETMYYDEASMDKIINVLTRTYGVEFEYDREKFSKCKITIALDEGSMYDKLDILTKVLSATYEVDEDVVRISGPGCGNAAVL
ncbi:FecR family protein [Chitinophaga sp. GCM10012297]|uniref:FecR family protein n=1 Tax=Chitinophaga chungangae TaxID=2821488 RepID=A0ABS3YI45_9BACT|nr:FecR family protein [Chitinophaga chungangae]MBO9153759.1 FecR family protein [Chitinophaga chungangae]